MTGHNTVTLKSGAIYQGATWTAPASDLDAIIAGNRETFARNLFEPSGSGEGVLQLVLADGTALVVPATEVESIVIHVNTP